MQWGRSLSVQQTETFTITHCSGVGTGGGCGPNSPTRAACPPPNNQAPCYGIYYTVYIYIVACIIFYMCVFCLCWFYHWLLYNVVLVTPPNTPWPPQSKIGSYSTALWTLLHLLTPSDCDIQVNCQILLLAIDSYKLSCANFIFSWASSSFVLLLHIFMTC